MGIAVAVMAIFSTGCASPFQRNINEHYLIDADEGNGLIVGSVSAPPIPRGYSPTADSAHSYHDVAKFFFRSRDQGSRLEGVLTSGTKHPRIDNIPACESEGLAEECGRLFAIRLPAGTYEIYRGRFGDNPYYDYVDWERPAVFPVAAGKTIYLGNLHVEYCKGRPTSIRSRGSILGADVSLRDRYERDTALIRQRFAALQKAEIIRQPLPDPAWRFRVPWTPYDWETCAPGQE